MCSFATGAGSRVMTSTFGCARVRVVTLEKKLVFCSSCTGFGFHTCTGFVPLVSDSTRLVYKVLALASLKSSLVNGSIFYSRILPERGGVSIQIPATLRREHPS